MKIAVHGRKGTMGVRNRFSSPFFILASGHSLPILRATQQTKNIVKTKVNVPNQFFTLTKMRLPTKLTKLILAIDRSSDPPPLLVLRNNNKLLSVRENDTSTPAEIMSFNKLKGTNAAMAVMIAPHIKMPFVKFPSPPPL